MLYTQIDKNKLLKNTLKPRLIFVGGSNLAYGLDSKKIKDSLNINPINTGVHVNLGLKFMLSNTLQYIKPGDIIVLSSEYQQFYGNLANGEGELLSLVTDIIPQSRKLLDYQQVFTLAKLLPEYAQSKLRPIFLFYKFPKNDGVGRYDRAAFNNFGDATAHWKLSGENPKPYPAINESFNLDALQALLNFRKEVYQKKAKLYVTFPGYQKSSYQNSVTKIMHVKEVLKDNHFLLISSPEEYIIPDSLIFDTPYHLTKKGVDYRTELLIQDLKKAIKR
ncbi:hypothetical protein [uncultured Mucilaginibacter sp.]|uniref:hypothetical protein n=1 Tax=uncultured Mucilaginibacter sp. TaxID=797541 RepID=UPI00262F5270|nr:hypothetical protein [uncultured Mucilaginibacter sp.]